MALKGSTAIIGVHDTRVGKVPEKSATALCVEAVLGALADAGLRLADVDGLVTCNSMAQPHMYHAEMVAEYLGLKPRYCATAAAGGGATFTVLYQAALAIEAGICDTVVIAMADSLRSGLSREAAMVMQSSSGHAQFETPYGATVPGYYALIAQAYLHAYDARPEHFAAVAVSGRQHACLNPAAEMRKPITIEDVLASRLIADPLRLLDCSLVSDGGAAVVLTRADRAAHAPHSPVYLLGAGEGRGHEHISQAASLTQSAARLSGERAYAMAGLSPADVDLAQVYDCFTPVVLIEMEDLGLCGVGEAGDFFLRGDGAPGGRLPINTHGGLLSHTHPGNPGSMFALTESVRQLRGGLGERQVADANVALVHAQGGILSSHCTVLLGTEATL
ncbi:MAG: thiolase family protein [Pseudomonadales bacterium]|nr:thiolase family protein [Pseudomonadales bacterium]MCP5185011.1 thiolase family protein [Pseudomonadales bacterium]